MLIEERANMLIEEGLRWLGIEAAPSDCDICEDGSVWHGLVQVLPKRTLV